MKLPIHKQPHSVRKKNSEEDVLIHKLVQTIAPMHQHGVVAEELEHQIHNVVSDLIWHIQLLHRGTRCPFNHVGIIGDGLMGRSIAKTIEAKRAIQNVQVTIKNHGWEAHDFDTCDLIIIAVPILSVEFAAQKIATELKSKLQHVTVIDIASVKGFVAEQFDILNTKMGDTIAFIPTHPMAGKSHAGKRHSTALLFTGKPWILCPTQNKGAMKGIQEFVSFCGADPIVLDAQTHDTRVALISHMPALLSATLLSFVQKTDPKSIPIAGPGFESMTRLAKSDNMRLHTQMFAANRQNIEKAVAEFITYLANYKP